MSEFSLRDLVREVLGELETEDLAVIAKEAQRRIPEGSADAAVAEMLPSFVRDVIRSASWSARQDAQRTPQQRSAKVAAIRDAWARHLENVRYTVEDGSSRRLGDLTRADVLFLANGLERKARENRARAMGMRALASAMTEHDALTVRELPVDYLAEMFGRAA